MMMWMMPLMSIYIAFIVPAALGVYWIAQSAFSIIQEMVLGKFYTKKLQEEEDARQEMIAGGPPEADGGGQAAVRSSSASRPHRRRA